MNTVYFFRGREWPWPHYYGTIDCDLSQLALINHVGYTYDLAGGIRHGYFNIDEDLFMEVVALMEMHGAEAREVKAPVNLAEVDFEILYKILDTRLMLKTCTRDDIIIIILNYIWAFTDLDSAAQKACDVLIETGMLRPDLHES